MLGGGIALQLAQNREQALALLYAHTQSAHLRQHALSVEAAMRAMARHFHEDASLWGVLGLLHDIDYEQYPDEHLQHTEEMLQPAGWDVSCIRAILSHGYGLCNDVEPKSNLEKSLYAVDELTGLITACVLVRPSRSILDLEVKSVKKKWKTKGFAAGCKREVILDGAARLGMELDTLIQLVLDGMREQAHALGLDGGQEGLI